MEAVIDQPLRDVAGSNPLRGLPAIREDALVHTGSLVGKIIKIAKLAHDIVGVEHGVFRGLAQSFGAIRQDVRQRAHSHAKVSIERADPPDAFGTIKIQSIASVRRLANDGEREIGLEQLSDGDGARARAATAMWG